VLRGTFEPAKGHPPAVLELQGQVAPPLWLSREGLKAWLRKVAIYDRRGQSIVGLEEVLGQYCELEAALISVWKSRTVPPMQWITTYRIFAGEFYDTPASQQGARAKKPEAANPFLRNGRPTGTASR
jgi:hypothetical protein